MLALTPHVRIFVALDSIDFRAGINRIAAIAEQLFQEDPKSGILFVFRNKKASEAKLLVYDGDGFYLIHRRLSCGKFSFWPKTLVNSREPGIMVESTELMTILSGGDPRGSRRPAWKRIKPGEFEKEEESARIN